MKITAKQNTIIKLQPEQSSELTKTQKLWISEGTELELDKFSIEKGHIKASIYCWEGHWEQDKGSNPIPNSPDEINWQDFNSKVSKYFTVGEVTNYENRRIPTNSSIKNNILALAKELDKVREQWGDAIIVTSWYRPLAVNQAIGGATNSQHLYGKAADIKPSNGELHKFQSWLDETVWKNRALGYGANKGFVHVDLRQGRIRWNY